MRSTVPAVAAALALASITAANAQRDAPALADRDAEFLQDVVHTGEVQLSLARIASSRAENAAVRSYARLILEERGRIQSSLVKFARTHDIGVDDAKALPSLQGLQGVALDRAFVGHAIDAETSEVKLFTAAVTRAEHPSLRTFSTDALPFVRKHLEAGKRIRASLANGGTGAITSNAPYPNSFTGRQPPADAPTPVAIGAEARQPIQPQPLQTQPLQTQPLQTQPLQTQPLQTQPLQTQPLQTQPVETQPLQRQPTETQPLQTQPTETQPLQTQPAP